jgi:hypothetical protein
LQAKEPKHRRSRPEFYCLKIVMLWMWKRVLERRPPPSVKRTNRPITKMEMNEMLMRLAVYQ